MTKEYGEFVKSLNRSRMAAWNVASWLHSKGMNIRLLPATTTPTEKDRFSHVDLGDLEITQRIEVKLWPHIDFMSIDDVQYQNIIVDEKYKIDKYGAGTLYGYIILNASQTACMLIHNSTRRHWFADSLFDKVEKSKRTFMLCPKSYVRFLPIT